MRTAIRITLVAGVSTCALLWTSGIARAQSAAVPAFTLKQVGTNVWAAIDNPAANGVASSNSGFVIGDDGVAVIDSFMSAAAAKELLAEIRRRTALPIKFVINTHHHFDHVAGNGVFADAGATIVAHHNVRAWIRESLRFVDDKTPPEIRAALEGLRGPSVVYTDALNLYLGTRQIQVRFFPGHTGGDSVVFIPDAGVVFAGDLLWRRMLPNMVHGTATAWMATLDTLAKGNARDTFIPGHGDVAKAQDLAALRDYFETLLTLIGNARRAGTSGKALVEAMTPALKKTYGEWDEFAVMVESNITDTEAELNGTKRVPQP